MDSFNLIGELLLRLSTNYIFCCLFCCIKKIFKWVPKTYIHCLLLSLILQSVSMILIKALPTKFFGFVWIFSDFVILKIAPVNNNQLHLTQSELSALKERIPYVLFFVNLTCIILRSPPIEKTLSNELEGLTAAMLSDALTLLIFVLKKIYGRSGRLSVPVGCSNRVVPNHSLLKILTLPKIDNFINFVFILRLS